MPCKSLTCLQRPAAGRPRRIRQQIGPGEAIDQDRIELTAELRAAGAIPPCRSLEAALGALSAINAYLLDGGVCEALLPGALDRTINQKRVRAAQAAPPLPIQL